MDESSTAAQFAGLLGDKRPCRASPKCPGRSGLSKARSDEPPEISVIEKKAPATSDGGHKHQDFARGRSSRSNASGRFELHQTESFDDGWSGLEDDESERVDTTLTAENTKTILSRNESPDIGFDRSVNPYRGCEHGCIYCFARPTHAYLGLSPGLDFETKLFFKPEAASLLRKELSKPGYVPERVQLGANTDCYQPVEKRLRITRAILEVLGEFQHPLGITTKNHPDEARQGKRHAFRPAHVRRRPCCRHAD
jgi:hypothetical protein